MTSQPRIALLARDFPVVSETFVVELARSLFENGHNVEVLACGPASERVEDPLAAALPSDLLVRRTEPPKSPLAQMFRPPIRPLAALTLAARHPASWPQTAAEARLFAASGHIDVLHCQFATLGLLALRHMRLGSLDARALVVHVRGSDVSSFVEARGADVFRTLFSQCALVIANSEHFRDRACALGCPGDKIRVIGSPIDTDYFCPPTDAREPYDGNRPLRLVAVGRLVEKKGFADAVAALARLRDDGLDARLEIVGDGPLRADLSAQIAQLGILDAVSLVGAGSREMVRAALYRADILLAPSVRAASGDEDAPVNTLKEAMATGMPVVATWHGGIPELVVPGENGLLVPERDSAALAGAIARLAGEPTSWHQLGTAGRRKVVQVYDRKAILRQTLDAYDDALSGSETF